MSATLLRPLALLVVARATMMRGVDQESQAKYQGNNFRCLDGSANLNMKWVNDDFCDCKDGSDEPGTGACAGKDTALFHCKNAGATPQLIYSSRVDDGVCDCCDGSDEEGLAARRPGKSCVDTCAEEGARDVKERSDRMEKLKVGLEKKAAIISEAEASRAKWHSDMAELQKSLPELEAELERVKKVEAEAEAARKSTDSEALQAEVESLRKQVADLQKEVADLKVKLQAASAGGEAAEGAEAKPAAEKKVVSEYAKWMDGAGSTPGAIENPAEEEPLGPEEGSEEEEDDSPGPTRPISSTAGSTKAPAVTEAEKKVRENKDSTSKLQKKIDQVADESRLAFASLMDKCISKHDGQYDYKLCFFDDAKQDHVLLGRWDAWTGPKEAMFKHGHMCPGGPERELKVVFECGAEEELIDIAEPSRCAYEAHVSHPGACTDADMELLKKPPVKHPRDEL